MQQRQRKYGRAEGTLVGGVVSSTMTVKDSIAELPLSSVAVEVTGVVPSWNIVPEGGTEMTFGEASHTS